MAAETGGGGAQTLSLEAGVVICFVTAAAPTSSAGCSGATPELVRLAVHEFVRDGFPRVGVLRGGFAALATAQRAALVSAEVKPEPSAQPLPGVLAGAQRAVRNLSFGRLRKAPSK